MSTTRYTIVGMTEDGVRFRPSDWAERLICTHPKDFQRYNGHLKMSRTDGVKAVIFDDELRFICPLTYDHLMDFARINKLQTTQEVIGAA